MELVIDVDSAMQQLGGKLAAVCNESCNIYLSGELGAGKTTLIRGFIQAKGYQGKVKSPTYTLIEPYQLPDCYIYHFDLYRINEPLELEALGLRDYFDSSGICLVEWPQLGETVLPSADISITITIQGQTRLVSVDAVSKLGVHILSNLQ